MPYDLFFIGDRAEIAQRRAPPLRIVPHLDELEQVPQRGRRVLPVERIPEFDLERREGAFNDRVIITVPAPTWLSAIGLKRLFVSFSGYSTAR